MQSQSPRHGTSYRTGHPIAVQFRINPARLQHPQHVRVYVMARSVPVGAASVCARVCVQEMLLCWHDGSWQLVRCDQFRISGEAVISADGEG